LTTHPKAERISGIMTEKIIDAKEIRKILQRITKEADGYFQKIVKRLADPPKVDRWLEGESPPDFYWSQLGPERQSEATRLIKRLQKLFPTIVHAVQETPALTPADQIDVGFAVKSMRAAVRLHRYRFSEIQVLHDEGIVLGVQPPSQSEDELLRPKDAQKVFGESCKRLKDIVDLIGTTVGSLETAAGSLSTEVTSSYRRGTAFIMMWMDPTDPQLEDVSKTVKRCFDSFSIKAVRSDDIQHEDLITKRILDEIKTAEFLFADLTGARPSVYYEVGYAHAIGRRVILFRKRGTRIHFDLVGYNCPEWKNMSDLETQLGKRLEFVTGLKSQPGNRRGRSV